MFDLRKESIEVETVKNNRFKIVWKRQNKILEFKVEDEIERDKYFDGIQRYSLEAKERHMSIK